jgi:hypothetical protein
MSNRAKAQANDRRTPHFPAALFKDAASAATHLEAIRDDANFEAQWNACMEAFDGDFAVWRVKAIRLVRKKSHEEAIAFIDRRDSAMTTT